MAQQIDPFLVPKLDTFYGGWVPTPPDPRDYMLPHLDRLGAERRKLGTGSVDLRQYQGQSQMIPIRDQGQIGSCTGMAWARMRAAAAAKYHIDQNERPDLGDDISPRFIYDLERSMTGNYPNDTGANMRDGGDVLNKYGVCPERYLPYTGKANNGPITTEITPQAYAAALYYGVTTYYTLAAANSGQALINSLLGCLDTGWCAVIAILVPPSYEQNVASSGPNAGKVPMPGRGEQVLGGHALTVCGYYFDNSAAGGIYFVLAGSWATTYGDGGYSYLPAAYFTTSSGQYGPWGQEALTLR